MTGPVTISVSEAARLTGLSESHVRRHAPTVKVGRRTLVPLAWARTTGRIVSPGEDGAEPNTLTDARRALLHQRPAGVVVGG